jgi:hypothetical protein
MGIEQQLADLNISLIRNQMTIGPAFATIADVVLKFGHSFDRRPLPRGRWQRDLGACYENALKAAMTGRYIYVEGYAVTREGSLPRYHAWVTDPANPTVAFDPTWENGGVEYFGIPFRLDYLLMAFVRFGHPGVLDVWEHGWPLVSGTDRIEEVMWRPDTERSTDRSDGGSSR